MAFNLRHKVMCHGKYAGKPYLKVDVTEIEIITPLYVFFFSGCAYRYAIGCNLIYFLISLISPILVISKLTFNLSAFPCFLTCCQLTKSQKAEKYKSCLLLDEVLRIKHKT